MKFDFSKIKPKKRGGLPVDPVELFQKLKVYDPGINDRLPATESGVCQQSCPI